MIDRSHRLPLARQARELGISRGSVYYLPKPVSAADLAMHVVLPEVDGRIFAGVASFKAASEPDPDLQFSRLAHRADPERQRWWRDRATRVHGLLERGAPEHER